MSDYTTISRHPMFPKVMKNLVEHLKKSNRDQETTDNYLAVAHDVCGADKEETLTAAKKEAHK